MGSTIDKITGKDKADKAAKEMQKQQEEMRLQQERAKELQQQEEQKTKAAQEEQKLIDQQNLKSQSGSIAQLTPTETMTPIGNTSTALGNPSAVDEELAKVK